MIRNVVAARDEILVELGDMAVDAADAADRCTA
jgi:hypothetical protein